jgi:hypothetical protein
MNELEKRIRRVNPEAPSTVAFTELSFIIHEAKKDFPSCLSCDYGERNEASLTGCSLDIGLRTNHCPKNIWLKKWFVE